MTGYDYFSRHEGPTGYLSHTNVQSNFSPSGDFKEYQYFFIYFKCCEFTWKLPKTTLFLRTLLSSLKLPLMLKKCANAM